MYFNYNMQGYSTNQSLDICIILNLNPHAKFRSLDNKTFVQVFIQHLTKLDKTEIVIISSG